MTSAPRPRPRPRPIAPATALVVALLAAGCSGDEESGDAGPDLVEPSDPPTLAIEPVTDLGKVTGRIPRKVAKTVEQRVSRVAIDWLTDAYVGGSYPRRGFDGSFAGFSRGARAAALHDLAVMTNQDIGDRVDRVTPTKMDVTVDLLAIDERAVGATAHVLTTYRAAGEDSSDQGRYRVAGRLLLTKDDGRWTTFAYHVSKGER